MAARKAREKTAIELLREDLKTFKKSGKQPVTTHKTGSCIVCSQTRPLKYMDDLGKGEKDVEKAFRCKRAACRPGGSNWMRTQKHSRWYRYYKEASKGDGREDSD